MQRHKCSGHRLARQAAFGGGLFHPDYISFELIRLKSMLTAFRYERLDSFTDLIRVEVERPAFEHHFLWLLRASLYIDLWPICFYNRLMCWNVGYGHVNATCVLLFRDLSARLSFTEHWKCAFHLFVGLWLKILRFCHLTRLITFGKFSTLLHWLVNKEDFDWFIASWAKFYRLVDEVFVIGNSWQIEGALERQRRRSSIRPHLFIDLLEQILLLLIRGLFDQEK